MHVIKLYFPEAPSGTAELYNHGTLDAADVYADADGEDALSSVTLSSAGRATVYVLDRVDVIVRDSEGTLVDSWTEGVAASSVVVRSAGFTGTLASGSQGSGGAVDLDEVGDEWFSSANARDYKVRLAGTTADLRLVDAFASTAATYSPYFNVKSYGAIGDNVADDYAAWVLAYTAAAVSGGVVFFPPGTYYMSQPMSITSTKVSVLGCGPTASIIRVSSTLGPAITVNPASSTPTGQYVRDLAFTATAAIAAAAIQVIASPEFVLDNCSATNLSSATGVVDIQTTMTVRGGYYDHPGTVSTAASVISVTSSGDDTRIIGTRIRHRGSGVAGACGIVTTRPNVKADDCKIVMDNTGNTTSTSTGGFNVANAAATGATITNSTITSAGCPCISMSAAGSLYESGNTLTTPSVLPIIMVSGPAFYGSRLGKRQALAYAASVAPDTARYEHCYVTATGALAFAATSALWLSGGTGSRFTIIVLNSSGGNLTPTFGAAAFRVPAITAIPNTQYGRYEFLYDDASGAAGVPWVLINQTVSA